MVALTILSLVLLATVTGLRTLANTQTAIERQTERVDEMRTVSSFLRSTLESAVVGAGGGGGGLSLGGGASESAYFEATAAALAWKSTILFGENYGGAYLLRVAREDERLVLRWQEPGQPEELRDWRATDSRVLVDHLEAFKLSFRRGFVDPWVDAWTDKQAPALVRLQLKSSGRYWPDLIVQVPQ